MPEPICAHNGARLLFLFVMAIWLTDIGELICNKMKWNKLPYFLWRETLCILTVFIAADLMVACEIFRVSYWNWTVLIGVGIILSSAFLKARRENK